MARTRPRKGQQKKRGVGPQTASRFAGLFSSSETSRAPDALERKRSGMVARPRNRKDARRHVNPWPSPSNSGIVAPRAATTADPLSAPKRRRPRTTQSVVVSRRGPRRSMKKRLLALAGTVCSLVAVSSLVTGVSFAIFNGSLPSQSTSITAGSVSVGSPSVSSACAVSGVLPGASSTSACTFSVTYTGTVPAYVGADVLVVSGDATHTALWDGTASGLQLGLDDGAQSDVVPTSALASCAGVGSQFGTFPAALTCGEVDNVVLTTTPVPSGTLYTLHLNWRMPTTSLNANQGGSAQIYVNFHAVQSGNNTLDCSPVATLGHSCVPAGTFGWG